jgi:hypothetical protein
MDKLREWGFPVALIVSWMVAAAYTVSFLIAPIDKQPAPDRNSPEITDAVVVSQR